MKEKLDTLFKTAPWLCMCTLRDIMSNCAIQEPDLGLLSYYVAKMPYVKLCK